VRRCDLALGQALRSQVGAHLLLRLTERERLRLREAVGEARSVCC
jgi:hypothetical protein